MICPVCHSLIPDGYIVCLTCAQNRSEQALAAAQLEPLRQVLAGKGPLTIRAIANKRHIQMFGAPVTFCGETIDPDQRKTFHDWGIDDIANLCLVCLREVAAAMKRAAPELEEFIAKETHL